MRSTMTVLAGTLVLAFPAGALAHGGPGGNQSAGHNAGRKGAAASQGVLGTHGRGSVHRHVPMVALVAHGSVVSVDTATSSAVVQVVRANHHGSGLLGAQVTIDLSKAAISVADANGDGKENLADVAAGDQVLVQGRIPLHGGVTGELSATRLIDQTHQATSGALSGTQTASTN